ncbi:hypothetical protein [Dyadobacter sediminis]|uniref:Uncharacterized protein n=1 Tax=Dyadobacter sediminis TaxID=1493691 RepID=A0A5R9KB93_9BACT|nr:hypothetical protein [Dyadobacter sediminis]TLU91987.1 hypothetical protein FEM55_14595 [Dyadobacter sediminis]GGB98479.1 hypothetical protein GCM10011325_27180 [Dyadobacter sediminis]
MANRSNKELTVIPIEKERTEEEIIEAMREFAMASYESVGVNNTYNTLKFMTQIVKDSPETYRKIFHPKTMEKLKQITESRSTGGKMSTMEMLGLVGDITSILT